MDVIDEKKSLLIRQGMYYLTDKILKMVITTKNELDTSDLYYSLMTCNTHVNKAYIPIQKGYDVLVQAAMADGFGQPYVKYVYPN